MNSSIIVLTSVTAAKRAQKILERNGVSCNVIRTPSGISNGGCSNSLKLKTAFSKKAVSVLKDNEFNIRGVYKELYDGLNYRYVK